MRVSSDLVASNIFLLSVVIALMILIPYISFSTTQSLFSHNDPCFCSILKFCLNELQCSRILKGSVYGFLWHLIHHFPLAVFQEGLALWLSGLVDKIVILPYHDPLWFPKSFSKMRIYPHHHKINHLGYGLSLWHTLITEDDKW